MNSRIHDVAFLEAVQARTARISVGPSTTRGSGPGVVEAGRCFLAKLPLAQFAVNDPSIFRKQLNSKTLSLSSALPSSGRSWGLARKLLNIFLRDSLYTTYLYLSDGFSIREAEDKLEIPLDSITARQLREEAGPRKLPRWKGVKYLTAKENDAYQTFATHLAISRKICRVHLDTYWWGQRHT